MELGRDGRRPRRDGEYGLVVDGHGKQELTPEIVDATDLVLGMTRNHVAYTVRRFPVRVTARSWSASSCASGASGACRF